MSNGSAAVAPSGLRRQIGTRQRKQGVQLAVLIGGLLLLLSVFSAGFFLYSVVVVVALLVVSLGVAVVGLSGIEVRRTLSRSEVVAGETVDVTLTVHNSKELSAPWLYWWDQIDEGLMVEGPTGALKGLGPGESFEVSYELFAARRGLYRIGPSVTESSGPFGLVRRYLIDAQPRFLTVFPSVVPIGRGWPLGHRPIHEVPRLRSLFEDPSRFIGIREYRHGDSPKRVHWRASARARRLQVKLYEPAVLEGVLLALEMRKPPARRGRMEDKKLERLVDGWSHESMMELGVTAAASIADFVLAGGQSVGLISNGADAAERYPSEWSGGTFRRFEDAVGEARARRQIRGWQPVEVESASGRWQRDRLHTALARLVPASNRTLGELLFEELPRLPRSVILMVITARLDADLCGALDSLKRSGFELAVVWIRHPEHTELGDAAGVPENVPVYPVATEHDLECLGARGL